MSIDTEGDLPVCQSNADCGGALCDNWRLGLQGDLEQERRMDHIHATGTDCQDGTPNELFKDSGYVSTTGDWDAPYRIDIVMAFRDPPGGGRESHGGGIFSSACAR